MGSKARSSRRPRFEIYKDSMNEFRWRFVSKDGEVLTCSQGYKNKADCKQVVELLKAESANARIDDITMPAADSLGWLTASE